MNSFTSIRRIIIHYIEWPPLETYDGKGYDREKYRELLLDAAETVLSTLGFSRREFGSRTRK